jgi:hypothetical protein
VLTLLDKLLFYLGQTAYMAWKEYSKAKKVHIYFNQVIFTRFLINKFIQGEIVFVSGGSGRLSKYSFKIPVD